MSSAVDSASAICLRIYERDPDLGDAYGAERFAIFCLGMEARTAYEWFYGSERTVVPGGPQERVAGIHGCEARQGPLERLSLG